MSNMNFTHNASYTEEPLPTMSSTMGAVLEGYIPAYSMISRIFSSYFHIDITSIVSIYILLSTLAATLRLRIDGVFEGLLRHCVSRVEIRMDDEMYNYLMYWVSRQNFSARTTRFVAGTSTRSHMVWDDEESSDEDSDDDDVDESDGLQDFNSYWDRRIDMDKNKPLRITPADGDHWFWYKKHLIAFERRRDDKKNNSWIAQPEKLYLKCFGRNPAILKDLLQETQRTYAERDGNKTIIYRGQRNPGETNHNWVRCMARPPRPLSSVVLDEKQKEAFLADVKEYLHPSTRRWYSNRGIPYRRGYMFHGPPGTGKSSLCFAAAGSLRLRIYLVSLNSKTLTEDSLARLFQSLPRRCIVLLEDVDAAGLTETRAKNDSKDEDENIQKSRDKKERGRQDDNNTSNQGISLSGLLNIIDGVASSEGRILVMTTNHIEKLDAALLRPGRIDMTISFGYSDRTTIMDLFRAIYAPLEGDFRTPPPSQKAGSGLLSCSSSSSPLLSSSASSSRPTSSAGSSSLLSTSNSHTHTTNKASDAPKGFIHTLSSSFADSIPANEFTPAEIQGYLLRHKRDPEEAIAGAQDWARDIRAEKKAKKAAAAAATAEDKQTREDNYETSIETGGFSFSPF